jgi:pyridoxal phosphate enzyme (YggS family)
MTIAHNLERVEARIRAACTRAGRPRDAVEVIVAGKYADAAQLQAVVDAGYRLVGENRVQAAKAKHAAVHGAVWHGIGPLQTNKVKPAVEIFDMIHALDRVSLADALHNAAVSAGKTLPVLIQVNIAGEATKAGVSPAALDDLVRHTRTLPRLALQGLMTMPPAATDAERSRGVFRRLAEERDRLEQRFGSPLPALSMGTSQDFETAIEEHSTYIRLGRQIFGPAD